jgi:micrococcal nuclease
MKRHPVLIALIFALAPSLVDAGDIRHKLSAGPSVKVIKIVDGDTVIVRPSPDGAAQIRLVGIQAPKLPLGRKGFKAWPLSAESKAALEQLILNRQVTLYFGDSRMDRHGRHLAHLFLNDGRWVQGALIEQGMARVYTFPDNRKLASEMYALERQARAANAGIWALPFYIPRPTEPTPLLKQLGSFQLIEGRVQSAAKVKGRIYLNFGANWRDDFTATVSSKAARLFIKAGQDPKALQGRRIRVRGWLRKRNGPMIDVSHPEQIEVLGEE